MGVTLLIIVRGAPTIGLWVAPDNEVGEDPDQFPTLLYIPIHIMDTPNICMAVLLSMSVHMAI